MPGFSVREMARAVEFYVEKLGFRVTFTNGSVFTIVARDGVEIGLMLDRGGKAGHGGCYLKMTGVDSLYQELLAKNLTMTHELKTESYGMREFMVTDPDGNTVNFGEWMGRPIAGA